MRKLSKEAKGAKDATVIEIEQNKLVGGKFVEVKE